MEMIKEQNTIQLKIGSYIQATELTRIYIDDICYEIDEDGSTTLFFICSEIHKSGIGSESRGYTESMIKHYLN